MADNHENPYVRMGEAVVEAFAATTGLLDPRVSNNKVGLTFRDELRLRGFDIVAIPDHRFPDAGAIDEIVRRETPHG